MLITINNSWPKHKRNHSCEAVFICDETHVDSHKTFATNFSPYTTSIDVWHDNLSLITKMPQMLTAYEETLSIQLFTNNKYARQVHSWGGLYKQRATRCPVNKRRWGGDIYYILIITIIPPWLWHPCKLVITAPRSSSQHLIVITLCNFAATWFSMQLIGETVFLIS